MEVGNRQTKICCSFARKDKFIRSCIKAGLTKALAYIYMLVMHFGLAVSDFVEVCEQCSCALILLKVKEWLLKEVCLGKGRIDGGNWKL